MIYGDRVRLLHSQEYLFVFSIESLPKYYATGILMIPLFIFILFIFFFTVDFHFTDFHSCLTEKVTIAVVNPLTFKVLKETAIELNDTVVDLALEQRNSDGTVILAIGQKSAGICIYNFDGEAFQSQQVTRIVR